MDPMTMVGIGSILSGGAAMGGMFGGSRQRSGRSMGKEADEFNQRSLYKYGITPYEALTAGASGNGANAIQGEGASARQFDAQMKMAAKDMAIKAQDLAVNRKNTNETNKTQLWKSVIDASRINTPVGSANPFLNLYNGVVEDIEAFLGNTNGETLSAEDKDQTNKNQQIYWDQPLKGSPKQGLKEGTDSMWNVVDESFSFGK